MRRAFTFLLLLTVASLAKAAPLQFQSHCYQRMDGKQATISIVQIHDSLSVMRYTVEDSICSEWELRYPVYQFCCHDLNDDGIPEIAVGVIKSTRYSPEKAKRLFIFKLYDEDVIRPLWLGSRVSHKLEDFTLEERDGKAVVHTHETASDGTPLQMLYYLKGFGLKFLRQIYE